jgi:hypothetical protein
MDANIDIIYRQSEDIVSREIEGDLIIVPLVSGIVDEDELLFTLNRTGKAIWNKLDGRRSLGDIIEELSREFEAPEEEIKADVVGLVSELVRRKMLISSATNNGR